MKLPPKVEQIVLMREQLPHENQLKHIGSVVLKEELWDEMEDQMDQLNITLNKFVNQAIRRYVNELYKEQELTDRHVAFSDKQMATSRPINIKPRSTSKENK